MEKLFYILSQLPYQVDDDDDDDILFMLSNNI